MTPELFSLDEQKLNANRILRQEVIIQKERIDSVIIELQFRALIYREQFGAQSSAEDASGLFLARYVRAPEQMKRELAA